MTDKVEQVRERLKQHKGSYPRIATESGVSKIWISRFTRGDFDNPGVRTLDKIEAWLDAHSADL